MCSACNHREQQPGSDRTSHIGAKPPSPSPPNQLQPTFEDVLTCPRARMFFWNLVSLDRRARGMPVLPLPRLPGGMRPLDCPTTRPHAYTRKARAHTRGDARRAGAQSQKILSIFIAVGAFQSSSTHVADTAMGGCVRARGGDLEVQRPHTNPGLPAIHSLLTWIKWRQARLCHREVIMCGKGKGGRARASKGRAGVCAEQRREGCHFPPKKARGCQTVSHTQRKPHPKRWRTAQPEPTAPIHTECAMASKFNG